MRNLQNDAGREMYPLLFNGSGCGSGPSGSRPGGLCRPVGVRALTLTEVLVAVAISAATLGSLVLGIVSAHLQNREYTRRTLAYTTAGEILELFKALPYDQAKGASESATYLKTCSVGTGDPIWEVPLGGADNWAPLPAEDVSSGSDSAGSASGKLPGGQWSVEIQEIDQSAGAVNWRVLEVTVTIRWQRPRGGQATISVTSMISPEFPSV